MLGLAALIASTAVSAQKAAKAGEARIGIVSLGATPATSGPFSINTIIRDRLRQLGWVEGKNLSIDIRFVGDGQNMSREIEDLLALRVDLIIAFGTPVVLAVRRLSSSVPVVFSIARDPVQQGLIESLGHPNRNLTGIYTPTAEHAGKRLGLLLEAAPGSARVAVIKFTNAISAIESTLTETAAAKLGVQLVPLTLSKVDEFESAFLSFKKAGANALSLLTDPRIAINFERLAAMSMAHGLPSIAGYPSYAQRGGLMAYGASDTEATRRTADFAAKILAGARAADLPVQQSTRFVLSLNLKTARALGVSFPKPLLQYADVVVS